MSVPEAPVDKDAGAIFAEDDVGFSRQTFTVDAIAKSFAPQPFAHDDFRLRVFRPDCRHVVVTLLGRENVHIILYHAYLKPQPQYRINNT